MRLKRGKVPMKRPVAGWACAAALGAVVVDAPARADQFHYNNVLIGTRAVGMGGAFGGVADDASGVYYNPAGLAFALSNDISGSANAFYSKSAEYKKVICGAGFEERSSGSVSPFFGGLQKLDRYVEGLVFAFGVYTIDSDLKDQDDLLENVSCPGQDIQRYHRTVNSRASTYYMGGAVAKRVTSNLSVGFGVNYFNADELVQEYQDSKLGTTSSSGEAGLAVVSRNVREHLVVHGAQPTLGVQLALPANLSVGLTVKKGIIASQRLDIGVEERTAGLTDAQAGVLGAGQTTSAAVREGKANKTMKKPVGSWPAEARLGFAWFASPTLLLALDGIYHDAVVDAERETPAARPRYEKAAVMDYAAGVEWYVAPAFPLRFGVFTNNDARPPVDVGTADASVGRTCTKDSAFNKKYCFQPDHIDYVGESLFIAWVQPNSQISVGTILQQGKGKAQKLGYEKVQDVDASSYTFAFSATHNL